MNQVDAALYAILSDNAELGEKVTGVYNAVAPETAEYPFVIFNEQSGTDSYVFGDYSHRNLVYLVKCVAKSPSAKVAGEVYDIIESILMDRQLTMDGYKNIYLRRESDVKYPEVVDGIQYWHVGALYSITVVPE